MKKITFLTITLVVIAGIGAYVAVNLHSLAQQKDLKEKEAESKRVVDVKYIQPRKGALERLCVQPGSVHSFERIQLFAKVSGYLEYQSVDRGSKVKGPVVNAFGTILKEADVLARLYVPDLVAQLERNEAAVDKSKAMYTQAEARVVAARAYKDAADSEVVFAKAMERVKTPYFEYREIQYGRMVDLAKRGAIEERVKDESYQQMNAAKEDLEAAKVKVKTAQANVVSAEAKIKQAEADVKEAEAEIKVCEADYRKAKVNVDFATIRAPFDGDITFRSLNPWDFVPAATDSGNTTPLLTVCRTDRFRVVVLVPDRDVAYIREGLPCMLRIDSLPSDNAMNVFYPRVSRLAEALDPHTRLMRVELDIYHDKDSKICTAEQLAKVKDEMYGQATIVLDRGSKWLSIPTACIAGKIDDGKGSIYVIRSGKARKLEVKVGLDTGLRLVVEKVLKPEGETLTEEDYVIVDPSSDLARQPEVRPVGWDDTSTIRLTKTER